MNNERIWTLIAKRLAGEATAEDLLDLYDLLQEHPEVHYSLEVFDHLWQQNQFAKTRPLAAYARLLMRMEQQGISFPSASREEIRRRRKKFLPAKLWNDFLRSCRNLLSTKV